MAFLKSNNLSKKIGKSGRTYGQIMEDKILSIFNKSQDSKQKSFLASLLRTISQEKALTPNQTAVMLEIEMELDK